MDNKAIESSNHNNRRAKSLLSFPWLYRESFLIAFLFVLGSSIQKAQEARIYLSRILAKYDVHQPIEMSDLTTKEKAQEYLGLAMDDIRAEKERFLKATVPKWLEEAKKREAKY